jgi:tetratricopeptide (TPR) repeat protein
LVMNNRSKMFITLFHSVFFLFGFIVANAQTAADYYSKGLGFFKNGQYNDALDNYNRAVKLDPNNTSYLYSRGYAYQMLNQFELAAADYTNAIGLKPNEPANYTGRGNCYFSTKQYDLALQDYFKAISLDPNNAMNYYNRARVYGVRNQFDDAIKDNSKAIGINPNYVYAYQGRGNNYFSKRMYDLAQSDYFKAISLEPNNPVNLYNMGNLLYAIKLYDQALDYYNKTISINPRHASAYYGRGIIQNNKKQYDLGIADLTKAISIEPTMIIAYNSRGLAYTSLGNYQSAISDFQKAMSMDQNRAYPNVVINIVEPLAHLHNFTDAAYYYNMYRQSNTNGYIDNPSWAFLKKYMEAISQNLTKNDYSNALKNLIDAENLYSTKIKVEADDEFQRRGYSSILALKGFVMEQLNNTEGAKQAYEQALLINPNQPDVSAAIQNLSKKADALVQTDKTDPVINIIEPSANNRSISVEDDKVAGTTQHIRGRAIDPSGIKSVKFNNKQLHIEENGYFDTVVTVTPGRNSFIIVATDNNANTTSINVDINAGKGAVAAADKPAMQASNAINYSPVYYGILIAEQNYHDANINELTGPVGDMNKIFRVLTSKYNFLPENTDTLVNATRATILESIIKKANAMGENDNLFIFYAGHGEMITNPDKSEEGFLVPQDATAGMVSSYISSDDLLRTIKYSKAKHILFVVDACFSGTLFRDLPKDAPADVSETYNDKSRKYLSSGNRKPVPDQSTFIEDFVSALQENRTQYITAEQLIDVFKSDYRKTGLQLQYNPIKNTDDQGGQFVFKKK